MTGTVIIPIVGDKPGTVAAPQVKEVMGGIREPVKDRYIGDLRIEWTQVLG